MNSRTVRHSTPPNNVIVLVPTRHHHPHFILVLIPSRYSDNDRVSSLYRRRRAQDGVERGVTDVLVGEQHHRDLTPGRDLQVRRSGEQEDKQ